MKSTPDICDENEGAVSAVGLQFQHYGLKPAFFGEAVTVKCFEDNSLVKELVNSDGTGKVLVVDGGGSQRRALLGDMLAEAAIKNGWQGLVINGCIRDVEIIDTLDIGVKALGTHPMKTEKLNQGHKNIDIEIAGVKIKSGYFIYADRNGVVVSEKLIE